MRLTKKREDGFYELKEGQEIYGEENGIRLVQIVGLLEDIEEQLGIDLITLFKALKNGFYFKDNSGEIIHFEKELMNIVIKKELEEAKEEIANYGKTWALTREEL